MIPIGFREAERDLENESLHICLGELLDSNNERAIRSSFVERLFTFDEK